VHIERPYNPSISILSGNNTLLFNGSYLGGGFNGRAGEVNPRNNHTKEETAV